MNDPLDKATSTAPPVIGEGCLSRYDPEALGPEDGAEFTGAAELWRQTWHPDSDTDEKQP